MIVKKGLQSQEILPENTCESLRPILVLIRLLDFGIRMASSTFKTRKQKINENNIIVRDKEYGGTPELCELVMATTTDDTIFINGDYDNYAEIMHSANALRRNK